MSTTPPRPTSSQPLRARGASSGGAKNAAARNQLERILAAVAAEAAERGHHAMTIDAVVARAGVSRSTFYEHFGGKDDAILAAVDAAGEAARASVATEFLAATEWPDQVVRAGRTVIEFMLARPDSARLVYVTLPAMGQLGLRYREARIAGYELFLAGGFSLTRHEVPSSVAHLIGSGVSGTIEGLVAREDWRGLTEMLPSFVYFCLVPFLGPADAARHAERVEGDEIALGFALPEVRTAAAAPEPGSASLPAVRSGGTEQQRAAILAAVADVAAEGASVAMTVDDVVRRAAISRKTFYECFATKEEAILAAVDVVAEESRTAVAAAYLSSSEFPEQVRRSGRALLQYMIDHPKFARLAYVEMPSMGAAGIAYREAAVASFELFLAPGYARAEQPVPAQIARMIGSAISGTIEGVVARGELDSLMQMLPGFVYLCLVPFIGPEQAAAEAAEAAAGR